MDIKEFRTLSDEQKQDALLESLSDSVRDIAHKLAMLKAISKEEQKIAPEDFDKAWTREFEKEWGKVKDKTGHELAMMALLEMMAGGMSMEEAFGDKETN